MTYPDCQSCVTAPYYCGWCSVNILYNSTIPGKNCAGINSSYIHATINCTGSFSIQTCLTPTVPPKPSIAPTRKIVPTSPAPVNTPGPTNKPPTLYSCIPTNLTCVSGGFMPMADCLQQCVYIPVVPPVLQNRFFRGLEIEKGYIWGEWQLQFTNTSVFMFSPSGAKRTGLVYSTSQYLIVQWSDGTKITTLWQIGGGGSAEVDFLSWAWSTPNGLAPNSFDEAMLAPNEKEYYFAACPFGKSTDICNFVHQY